MSPRVGQKVFLKKEKRKNEKRGTVYLTVPPFLKCEHSKKRTKKFFWSFSFACEYSIIDTSKAEVFEEYLAIMTETERRGQYGNLIWSHD